MLGRIFKILDKDLDHYIFMKILDEILSKIFMKILDQISQGMWGTQAQDMYLLANKNNVNN